MLVEVFSDTVCPWCFVGKRRFEQACAARPGIEIEARWLPFELNPDLPAEGMERGRYLAEKFGDPNRFAAAQQNLRDVGAELGIDFHFERIVRMPNTRRSHALIAIASAGPLQSAVKERVLEAYFVDGHDIGDMDVLRQIGADAGLDPAPTPAALEDAGLHREIAALESRAASWGIRGVPAFVFDRRYLVSGAQPTEVFLEVIDRIAAESESAATSPA